MNYQVNDIVGLQKGQGKVHRALVTDWNGQVSVHAICGCPGTARGEYQGYNGRVWSAEKINCKRGIKRG